MGLSTIEDFAGATMLTSGADFVAQDIDARMAKDGLNVVLTLTIGDTTCTVALPRERLEKLRQRITKMLAGV
jgi:hypothetical protein